MFTFSPFVWESSTTTGTGAFTLAGPVTVKAPDGTDMAMRAYSSALANGDTTWYQARNRAVPAEWEEGIGTWNTGGTLSRTTVLRSSNANAAVNFSSGTKDVISTVPSSASSILSTFTSKGLELAAAADAAAVRTAAGLGTAATQNTSAFATAAQGTTADAALPKAGGTMTGGILFTPGQSSYPVKIDMSSVDPYARKFNIAMVTGININPGDPARPNDTTMAIGYNMAPGAAREDPTEPTMGMSIENCYFQNSVRACELHLHGICTDGSEHRYLSLFHPHSSSGAAAAALFLSGNHVRLGDFNQTVVVDYDFPSKIVYINDTLITRYEVNNYAPHLQKKASGSGYNVLPYYAADDRCTIGASGVFYGPTPTTGSYANAFFKLQPTTIPAGGRVLEVTLPAVTGNVISEQTIGSATTGLSKTFMNSNNAVGTADTRVDILSGGASGGDPCITFAVVNAGYFTIGVDNSDSDKFKISNQYQGLGGGNGDALTIETTTLKTALGGPLQHKGYTVANLPTASSAGQGAVAYASNARKSGEGTGAGTGIPVWCDGTNWRTYYDNTVAAA